MNNDLPPGFVIDDLPEGFVVDEPQRQQGQSPTQPRGHMAAAGRAAVNVGSAPLAVGKQFINELIALGKNIGSVGEIDPASLVNPRILGETAVGTVRNVVRPIVESAPELVGGTLGTVAGGPMGGVAGATMGRGLASMGQGKSGPEVTEDLLTTLGVAGATAGAPAVGKYLVKAPGRHLSMPAERHAAGAAMMERIPERFGVDTGDVRAAYTTAEALAAQPPVARAPLSQLTKAVQRMNAQTQQNPLKAIKSPLDNPLRAMEQELAGLRSVNAGQVDSIVKRINDKIGSTTGSERGTWKQLLGAVHEDLKSAATTTGDPAFQAYGDAIRKARLNFLREDIEEAIRLSGVKPDRTGQSVLTSPGKMQQWIRANPEWAANVEKASPGLLDSIRSDIAEIVPVTDVVGRAIPGQRYGSGRLVLGGATGALLSKALGIAPETAASIGAIIGGVSPQMGIKMPPGYVERSFRPTPRQGSPLGTVLGGALAQRGRSESDPLEAFYRQLGLTGGTP